MRYPSSASVCQRQFLSVAKSELFSVDQHFRASDYHAVTEPTTDRPKAPFSLFFPDGCRVAHRSDANGGLTGCMPEERRDPRERGCKECEAKEWYRAEKEEKKPVLLSFRSLQTLRPFVRGSTSRASVRARARPFVHVCRGTHCLAGMFRSSGRQLWLLSISTPPFLLPSVRQSW